MYARWRSEELYLDLCLKIGEENIYVHKSLICENSELVAMLNRRNSINSWPPIHTIELILPDNLLTEDIKAAINYIYNKNQGEDLVSTLYGLIYLLVPDKIIVSLISSVIWKDGNGLSVLNNKNKHCLEYIIENRPTMKSKILQYFGKQLDYPIPQDLDVFGTAILSKKPISQMFYFAKFERKTLVEFCGINWIITNSSIACPEGGNIIKIYVDETCEVVEPIKLRVTIRIYTLEDKIREKRETDIVNPQEYKRYRDSNLSFVYDHDNSRISLLMEKK